MARQQGRQDVKARPVVITSGSDVVVDTSRHGLPGMWKGLGRRRRTYLGSSWCCGCAGLPRLGLDQKSLFHAGEWCKEKSICYYKY